jgi:hypothetical protein
LLYVDNATTVKRVASKHLRQKSYAEAQLRDFPTRRYQFWSPVVPKGYLTKHLAEIDPDLELVINAEYSKRINELRKIAGMRKNDENNPAFRLLQILAHMKS